MKLFHLGKKALQHELINGSFFVFFGSTIANFFAFLFNVFLIRMLLPSDYGIYASLLSLVNLFAVPNQSMTTIIIKFATAYFAHNKIPEAAKLYQLALKFTFIMASILFICFAMLALPLSQFLHITNVWLLVATGFIVAVSYLGIVSNGFLQSLLRFRLLAGLLVSGGLVKLIIGVILVLLGLRVSATLWAVLFSFLAPFVLGTVALRYLLSEKTKDIVIKTKEIVSYAIPVTLTILALSSFTATDILLVKHFFNAHDAGSYGVLSFIGKVIFYFTSPITSVMFPIIVKRHNTGENFHNIFYLSLAFVVIPSGAVALIYWFFPSLILAIFHVGKTYLNIAPYLGIFGLYLTIFCVINVFAIFFLSVKPKFITGLLICGAILQILLISLFHQNFYQVIFDSMTITLLLLCILLLYYGKSYGFSKKSK